MGRYLDLIFRHTEIGRNPQPEWVVTKSAEKPNRIKKLERSRGDRSYMSFFPEHALRPRAAPPPETVKGKTQPEKHDIYDQSTSDPVNPPSRLDFPAPPATTYSAEGYDRSLILDFETRNINPAGSCNLKAVGAARYAVDSGTEILVLGYQDGAGRGSWRMGEDSERLKALILDPEVHFVSFGAFDRLIWSEIMVKRHGFPPIPVERWFDLQATCAYLNLPRDLKKVLPVVGATARKDDAGRALVLSLSRRDKKTGLYPELTAERLEGVRAYNSGDIAGTVELHAMYGELPASEREIWLLDQKINERGIQIDLDFVTAAKAIAEASTAPLVEEFTALTKGEGEAFPEGLVPTQVERLREWLQSRGCSLPNLEDETIAEALKERVLSDEVRRALLIRQITASTSLKKLDAMLACAGTDGRVRGTLRFRGARTGRWSGALVQPQNFPRPTFEIPDPEALVTAVLSRDPAMLRPWSEQPLEVLAGALRLAITAREGSMLGGGDFALIEAGTLLALAGQKDKCELLASGSDPYRDMACTIYPELDRATFLAIPKDELDAKQKEQRRVGKCTILGCGFGMGAPTFREKYLKHLPRKEAIEFAEGIINAYRRDWAPRVPRLWRDLERTAGRAMSHPGMNAVAECGISYRLERKGNLPVLICQLLNGALLHYQNAVLAEEPGFYGPKWHCHAMQQGRWCKITPYGSHLCENVVQALARELLVAAMFRFEKAGFPIVLTVHDELIIENPGISEAIIKEIMEARPDWAEKLGIPVRVKAWTGKRYGK
jgi:DNA polymerase